MKIKFTLIALLFLLSNITMAIDPAYVNAMQKQLQALGNAESAAEFQSVANGFSRISQMNQDEWLPDYYTALAYTNAGFILRGNPEEQDKNYDIAVKTIQDCINRNGENAELIALKGYAMMGQLSVDPQTRGQQLSGLVMQTFGRALKLEPENPRAMSLMAQMQLGMSQFFGEGPEKACGIAKQSLEYFGKEEAQETDNPLLPRWGKESAQAVLKSCE
ncbi:hypothetical protein QYS48_31220 [Marivirga arenosa]|uniref:Tetratricopeptide repeat protein n=1 Tax=Marivirga arenosa TaxID=3059076 RepID=A0AA51RCP8_9BACT|nr:hypothetical protein [Marivirga sp. ABR2-2]WMN05990.1 hypothetical protein QYS48_31220 [Marivirga sp. ABR2-2]